MIIQLTTEKLKLNTKQLILFERKILQFFTIILIRVASKEMCISLKMLSKLLIITKRVLYFTNIFRKFKTDFKIYKMFHN